MEDASDFALLFQFLGRVSVFFVDQKYTEKGCWSEKDELQSVCYSMEMCECPESKFTLFAV